MKRLQLPKNKFVRLAINIVLILVWWNQSKNLVSLIKFTDSVFFFLGAIITRFGVSLYYGETFYHLIEAIIILAPIILVTWYFWNGNIKFRPRIYTTTSNADELEKYAELKDQGIITEDEFQAKKKKLLDL